MAASALRKHATTIVLVALVGVGAVTIAVIERGSVTTAESEARRRNLFEAWRTDALTDLTVTSRGKTARLFWSPPNDDGERRWEVEIDGQRYPADHQTADQYVGSLEFAVFERRVPPESVDRAAFKLDAPRVSVALALTRGGKPARLAIGGEAPTPKGAAYAEVEGRGVFVITAQLASALDVDVSSFRARGVAPYLPIELARMELDGEGGSRKLERASWGASRGVALRFDGTGAFGRARVNEDKLQGLFFALASLQAEVFLTDEQAETLPPGRVTLTLVPADPKEKRAVIDIGAPCPGNDELVAAVRREPTPLAVCVPKTPMEALSTPAEALFDRRLLGATSDTVTEVRLTSGGHTLELARKESGWHMREPSDREVEGAIGRGFVDSLLKAEASGLAAGDPSALGLASPRARVRVISTPEAPMLDGGPPERIEELEIGAEKDGSVYVRRLEDGVVLEVPQGVAAALFPSELSLRARGVIDEPAKKFMGLEIREGERLQRLRRTDAGGWELLEPRGQGLSADIGLATDVAEILGDLEVERWVATKDSGAFGLNRPRMVIEAAIDQDDEGAGAGGKSRALKLLLGAPTADGSFARLVGDEAVFVAPKRLEDAAGRWLIDRSALVVEPASVIRVTLEARAPDKGNKSDKGDKVVVERAGDGALRIAGAPADEKGAAKAAAIRDALGDLLAEGAVSVGKPQDHEGFEKPALTVTVEREGAKDAAGLPKRERLRIVIGAGDVWRGTSVRYARRDGVEATFAVAQSKVRPLLDAASQR